MNAAETLVETLANLTKKGFTNNFIIKDDSIVCAENNMKLDPKDFEIIEDHNFKGLYDLDDGSVAYAIKSDRLNIKGILVDAFGANANPIVTEFVRKTKKTNPFLKKEKLAPV
ncbi:MAG: hypothetical protein A3F72_11510 [Bacteroidetes bacterium RIFCSPLOWO2_12_FULL_35_15]|nr:MAG: hypothetical protein A3F72_11510 [Bacteroidetes bacterium RIFCSPLOWO2_12_FULL_35_15]